MPGVFKYLVIVTLQIKILAIFSIAKDKNKRFPSSIFFAIILRDERIRKWRRPKF